jgi:hypothetical protein
MPIPQQYGQSFTDTSGNPGVAKFDGATGKPLPTPTDTAMSPMPQGAQGAPGQGVDPGSFQMLLGNIEQKITQNNALATQRSLISKHLFDQPLTPQEMAQLPSDVRGVLQGGNKDAAMMQLQVLNDQIQGRSQSFAQSVQYISQGYDTSVKEAESKRTFATDTVLKVAQQFVDPATGKVNVDKLKQYMAAVSPGIDVSALIDSVQGLQPVSEYNKRLQYDSGSPTPGTIGASNDPVVNATQAIVGNETGGIPDAEAYKKRSSMPQKSTGLYSYGKYQVLESNIPEWTKAATGTAMTTEQFLNDPSAQDKVAQWRMGDLWKTYGNIEDVASVYFTGVPYAQAVQEKRKDSNGTTVEQYVAKAKASFDKSQSESNNPGMVSPSGGSNDILKVAGISLNAFNFLTGNVTAMSRMTSSARQKIVNEAQDWAAAHNIDVSTFKSQYESYNKTLSGNITRFNNTVIAENELKGTLSNLSTTISDADLGQIKAEDVAKILAGQQTNNPTASRYAWYISQLRNETAYYFAASQGKTSPDVIDNQDAGDVITNGISTGSAQGLTDAVTASTEKMKSVLQTSVDSAHQNVWSLFGVGDKFKNAGSSSSGGPAPSTTTDISSLRNKYGY